MYLSEYTFCTYIYYNKYEVIECSRLKKIGRPKSENTRSKKLNLRLREDELSLIEDCAKKLSLTRTDAIMQGMHGLYRCINEEEENE